MKKQCSRSLWDRDPRWKLVMVGATQSPVAMECATATVRGRGWGETIEVELLEGLYFNMLH